MAAKHGLGRGLAALIKDNPAPAPAAETAAAAAAPATAELPPTELPVGLIHVNPLQPRDAFAPESLDELAASIKSCGVLQPLLVRKQDGRYELVAGERRLRAARQAGLAAVPVRLVETGDQGALELALVENLQRADLNPMEEARGYRRLADQFDLSQEAIASRVGKARATVANALRLLDLPEEVQTMLTDGRLSAGHAKVLLGVGLPEERCLLARRAVTEGWSVRNMEKVVARLARGGRRSRRTLDVDIPPEHLRHLTDALHQHFGTAVRLAPSRTLAGGRKIKGTLEIDFYSNDDFNRILEILGVSI